MDHWNFASTHLHKPHLSSSHTYESKAHSTLSTIDHIMCHKSLLSRVLSSHTLPDHTSDNLPLLAPILLDHRPSCHPTPDSHSSTKTLTPRNCPKATKEDILTLYSRPLHRPLTELLNCHPQIPCHRIPATLTNAYQFWQAPSFPSQETYHPNITKLSSSQVGDLN